MVDPQGAQGRKAVAFHRSSWVPWDTRWRASETQSNSGFNKREARAFSPLPVLAGAFQDWGSGFCVSLLHRLTGRLDLSRLWPPPLGSSHGEGTRRGDSVPPPRAGWPHDLPSQGYAQLPGGARLQTTH